MSLSTGVSTGPLTIPEIDVEKDLGLETPSGSCKSYHRCTSLKADCLQSPVNPATWEGASSLARFGLDIGGTLCKVVYFEPFDHLQSRSASSKFVARNSTVHAESLGESMSETESARTFIRTSLLDSHFRLIEGEALRGNRVVVFDGQQRDHECLKEPVMSKDCCSGFNLSEERHFGEHFGELSTHTVLDAKKMTESGAPFYSDSSERSCAGVGECRLSPPGEKELRDTKHDSVNGKREKLIHEGIVAEESTANDEHFNQVPKIWVSSHDPVLLPGRGTLYFKCFETWRMEEFLLLTKEHSLVTGDRALGATGGGARKFGLQFLGMAGLQLKRADELKSLVRGIDFLMKHAQYESFEFPKGSFQGGVIQRPFKSPENSSDDGDSDFPEEPFVNQLNEDRPESKEICLSIKHPHGSDGLVKAVSGKRTRGTTVPRAPILTSESGEILEGNLNLYPYLVVNIGSGVSILLVDSPEKFQRVGGTSLGGSTFFGLASVLTGCNSFEEAIDLAADGDSTEIDMLVGDIYGGDYSEMGLAATTVASSFGKLVQPERRAAALKSPQHLAKATLLMITNNIGSLAKLHAQATGVDRVLFTGSFMHGNKLAMRLLAAAMEFWSEGQIKAIFLQHEGHAGAMGALLLSSLDPKDPTDALLLK